MELTFADLKELICQPAGGAVDPLDPQPGEQLLIRTVTMTLTGRVTGTSATWILLDDAAWIADTGRFADAIKTGDVAEVEPMGDHVRVARAAIVDVTPWTHPLPDVQR